MAVSSVAFITGRLKAFLFLILVAASSAVAASDFDTCAEMQAQQSIAACTRAIESQTLHGSDLSTVYILRGTLYRNVRNYDRAIADFTQAIQLMQHSATSAVIASALIARANVYALSGDQKNALVDYRTALSLDAGNQQLAEEIKQAEAVLKEGHDKVAVVSTPVPSPSGCGSETTTVSLPSGRAAQSLTAAEECAIKEKEAFKECDSCPVLVVIAAGSFVLGASKNEPGHDKDEEPQQQVKIEKSFAVGKFEITVRQYNAFVREVGHPTGLCDMWVITDSIGTAPGFRQDDSHPVVCVSWHDAKAYTAWLSKKTDKNYRLLSEAEWEYAARAGTTSRFYFGDDEKQICRYANSADQPHQQFVPGAAKCRDGYTYTSPVGVFAPNGFGLYDMLGNAWEWVEDCAHDSYKDMPDATKLTGAAWTQEDCTSRVMRGGGWSNPLKLLRSAIRFRWSKIKPDFRLNRTGFRVARTLTQ